MSKPTKWTPGPWRHVITPGGWDGVKEDAGPSNICLLSLDNPANADLIGAAPELYEAASRLLRLLEENFTGWPATLAEVEARDMVIAILAKARGE